MLVGFGAAELESKGAVCSKTWLTLRPMPTTIWNSPLKGFSVGASFASISTPQIFRPSTHTSFGHFKPTFWIPKASRV